MLYSESLKRHPRDSVLPALSQGKTFTNWKALDNCPCVGRRINGTRHAPLETINMIGVGMRDHDRIGIPRSCFVQPIASTINHHLATSIADGHHRMLAMIGRSGFDVAARSKKDQFHWGPMIRNGLPIVLKTAADPRWSSD